MNPLNKSKLLIGLLPALFLMTSTSAELPNPFNYNSKVTKTANANYIDNSSNNLGNVTNPYFFGGSIGPAEGSSYCSGATSCEDTDSAWKLFGGYKFTDRLSAEGTYATLGDLHKNGTNSDVSIIAAHGVASMPITEQFEILGKLGLMRWSSDNTDGGQSGFGVAYGVGAKMHLNETTKLRAEWEKFPGIETSKTEDTDMSLLSVGVELATF